MVIVDEYQTNCAVCSNSLKVTFLRRDCSQINPTGRDMWPVAPRGVGLAGLKLHQLHHCSVS